MRDEVLAAVEARNDRFRSSQDESAILGPEAEADAERLQLLAISFVGAQVQVDLRAMYVLAWFHWFRYACLPSGDDVADLREAERLFSFLREHNPDIGPRQLDEVLALPTPMSSDEKAASTYFEATGFLARYQQAGEPDELDRAINELARASRLMRDHESRLGILDELASALRTRFEDSGDLASLDRAIATNREILDSLPPDTPHHAIAAANLGNVLQIRYYRSGDLADIDSAIALCRMAAAVGPNDERPSRLAALANALRRRAIGTSSDADLEEGIGIARDAVEATPPDAPELVKRLCNLAAFHKTRYDRSRTAEDLDTAIELIRRAAVGSATSSPADQHAAFRNLGSLLAARFEAVADSDDLDASVRAFEQSLADGAPQVAVMSDTLAQLGAVLLRRADTRGDRRDLDKAIERLREAVARTDLRHDDYASRAETLGNALWDRVERYGTISDLDECIALHRAALDRTSAEDEVRPGRLIALSTSLRERGRRTMNRMDLDQAVNISRDAVSAVDVPGYRAMALADLGVALVTRYEVTEDPADLDAAVASADLAATVCPSDHPQRTVIFSHAGGFSLTRFDRRGDPADLEAALRMARNSVAATSDGIRLANLSGILHRRFDLLGTAGDLVEAIEVSRRAVSCTPIDDPRRGRFLNNLAGSIHRFWQETRQSDALDQSIVAYEDAAAALEGDPLEAPVLSELAAALVNRFDRSGDVRDLNDAVEAAKAASALPGPYRSGVLTTYSSALRRRYGASGEVADLDEAITVSHQAVALVPDDHPLRAYHLLNQGGALAHRFRGLGNRADLVAAGRSWTTAIESDMSRPEDRMSAATEYGTLLRETGDQEAACERFVSATQLLPLVAWRGLNRTVQEARLADWNGLATHAAATAVDARHTELALELLEQGRSVLWGQRLQVLDDFTALSKANSQLAARLAAVRDALDATAAAMPEAMPIRASLLSSGALDTGTVSLPTGTEGITAGYPA
jgi:tetratricopeptide (TPR) repeat protein